MGFPFIASVQGIEADAWALAIEAEFCREGRVPDAGQLRVMARLASLALAFMVEPRFLRGLRRRPPVRGVFLWGGVGRGKSCLVDALVRVMPPDMVCRYHQHVFLDDFHRVVSMDSGAGERFTDAVLKLIGQARLLVFDEFHAYDIADALILKRAFAIFQAQGVVLVLTANHCPWQLWPATAGHRQQARHFDPLVAFLRQHCDFVELDAGLDYRGINQGPDVMRWRLPGTAMMIAHDAGTAHFTFQALCGGLRSHADYAALCRSHSHLILEGLPKFGPEHGDALRRLIWLVDAAWEVLLPMTISADDRLAAIFDGIGDALDLLLGKDLKRTQSRLLALSRL